MDLITCGDALWISCGTWLALLNGSVGAALGAVVAVIAIVTTIKTQRRLFAVERSQAYTATLIAERKRKAELDLQLKAQREDLQLQLASQAKEASREREMNAIADVIAFTHELWWYRAKLSDPENRTLSKAHASAIRWRLEGTLMDNRVVENCVLDIGRTAGVVWLANKHELPTAKRLADELLNQVRLLEVFASSWPHIPPETRPMALAQFQRSKDEIADRVKAAESDLDPA